MGSTTADASREASADASGDASVDASVDSSAIDASLVIDHAGPVAGRRCANCDALAERTFCPHCGQATALHPPTAGEFLHEFLGHHIAIEGPLWRTLVALIWTPGRLTAEYFVGRRQRYIAPLRLYLTASLVLFATSSLTGGLHLGGRGSAPPDFQFQVPSSKDETVMGLRTPREGSAANTWMRRTMEHIAAMSPAERTERARSAIRAYLPYVLIVLVPFLALIFKLVYWGRHRFYGEHLVVALHAQTVAFLFALASTIPIGSWWGDTIIFALFVHGALALRRVYGGRWIPTILRETLVLTVYGIVVALSTAAVATTSLAT